MATTELDRKSKENDDLVCGSETMARHDDEAVRERWYYDEDVDLKQLFRAGSKDTSTAQRRERLSYSKLETRSIVDLDWRDVSGVSSLHYLVHT